MTAPSHFDVHRSGGFRVGAYRVLTYALFIATTFTIAGSETSIILLMALALCDPALWHWLSRREPPGSLPFRIGPPGWIPASFLVLVGVALLSALVNPGTVDTLDHMRFHYRVFLPLVLLLALPHVDLRRLLGTFSVFVAIWGLYGTVQFFFGVDWFRAEGQKLVRPYGTASGFFHAQGEFTHHITYGGVMLMATLLLVALTSSHSAANNPGERRRWGGLRTLWMAGAGLGALATVFSLARSAWLGLVVGLVVLALLRLPRRWGLSLAALMVLLTVGFAALAIQGTWLYEIGTRPGAPVLLERLALTSPTHDVDRLRMWQAGWLGVQDCPWLGSGMGNAGTALEPYRRTVTERMNYQYMLDASAGVHNMYLQVAFDLGVLGLVSYLAVWIAVFVWSGKALHALRPGLPASARPGAGLYRAVLHGAVAGLAGSMTAGIFENNAYDKEVQQLILMLMGLALYTGLRVLVPGGGSGGSGGVHWKALLSPNYAGVLPPIGSAAASHAPYVSAPSTSGVASAEPAVSPAAVPTPGRAAT